jgi:hypothetical protein
MTDPTPAPTPAPNLAPTPDPTPAPAPAPAAFDWTQHGLDTEALGYVQTKGWKGPADVRQSYRGAEKLIGVPPEQVIKLPGAKDAPEAWNPVWERLGRPATADGYKLPVPEGADPAFAKAAAGWFHEAGIPAAAAEKIAAKWNEHAAGLTAGTATARAAAQTADETQLKGEWRTNYDTNVGLAQRAAQAFGLDKATLGKMEDALGFGGLMKMMHNIGSKLGTDDKFVAGDGKGGFAGGETAQQAVSKIAQLRGDKGFVDRFIKGDTEARREMTRLHQIAYPGNVTL